MSSATQSFAGRFVRNATIYGIGNILRQVVGFVMLPIYTRYLSPSDYGVVGLVMAFMAIIETLFCAKLVTAIPRFYTDAIDEKGRGAVISTAFAVTGLMSAASVIAVVAASVPLSQLLFATPLHSLVVSLCGVQILTQALEYYGLLYFRLLERPYSYLSISVAKLIAQVALNVYLVVHLELGVLGVAASGFASSAVFAIGLTVWSLRKAGVFIDLSLARRLWAFSWPLWLAGLASLYIGTSSRYFMRAFHSLDSVGIFELASKFGGVLTLLVIGPVVQHWQTEQFSVVRGADSEMRLRLMILIIGSVLLVGAAGISVMAAPVIHIMAAPAFWSATNAVPFLVLAAVAAAIASLTSAKFLAADETAFLTTSRYGAAVIATVAYLGLIPLLGHVGAAAGIAVTEVCYLGWIAWSVRRRHGITLPLVGLLGPAIICAALVAAFWSVNVASIAVDIALRAFATLLAAGAVLALLMRNKEAKGTLLDLYRSRVASVLGRAR